MGLGEVRGEASGIRDEGTGWTGRGRRDGRDGGRRKRQETGGNRGGEGGWEWVRLGREEGGRVGAPQERGISDEDGWNDRPRRRLVAKKQTV